MTTYAFPTLARRVPNEWSFGQRSNTLTHTSPLSGQMQTVELPGARWTFSARFRNLSDPDRGLLEAFLTRMRGQGNRMTVHDFSKPVPRGTLRGSPVTTFTIPQGSNAFEINAGAGQAFTTLLAGDKLNVGGELKMVVSEYIQVDASGRSGLLVEPPFRNTIGGGATVVWDRPTAVFIMVAPDWNAEFGALAMADYAFDGIEAFA